MDRDLGDAIEAARVRCERASRALEKAEERVRAAKYRNDEPPLDYLELCQREKKDADLAYLVLMHT